MNDIPFVIAIDLGGTAVKCAAVDRAGTILARTSVPTLPEEGYRKVIERIAGAATGLLPGTPVAVGLGSAGAVDHGRGVVRSSPNLPDWIGVPVRDDLSLLLGGIPVAMENDANAAALGEGWRGAAREWDHFVLFTLGTGVGGGIVLDGRLWRGESGAAAELGHLTAVPGGRACGCGRSGCVEKYASATGVKMTARERYTPGASPWLGQRIGGDPANIGGKLVEEGADAGDPFCLDLLAEAGRHLGSAMGQVALVLDITRFVVGGGLGAALRYLEPAARAQTLEVAYTADPERLSIVAATLGNDAGMLGAARSAWELTGGVSA